MVRETTERPEAVNAGTAELVSTDPERIKSAVISLLSDPDLYKQRTSIVNPFGDGHAAERIVDCLLSYSSDPVIVTGILK